MPDKIIQLNKDLIKHDLKNDLVPKLPCPHTWHHHK